jgi:tetratricopeptide (TPR) repeat protein
MRLQIISLLVFFLCLFFTVKGQEVNYADDYNKGMEAYNKKDFPKSVKFFESSLSGQMKSAQAYTNLGLAYHKVGDIGRAVLNFERALRQSPGYSPARQNLRAARQLIDTNVKEHKAFWLFKVWEALALMLTSRTWSIMFYLLLFIGSAALLLWYISMNDKLKFIGIRLGLVSISSVSSGNSLYSCGLIGCASTRAKSEPEVRREAILFTFIGLSHAEYVANCPTRRVPDDNHPAFQHAKADDSKFAVVLALVFHLNCRSVEDDQGVFKVQAAFSESLLSLGLVVGQAH